MRNRNLARVGLLGALLVVASGLLVVSAEGDKDDDAATAARVPAVVPSEESARENPVAADKRSLDYGKLLFSSQCTMCHGKGGAGDGDLVGRLELTMPDLTDPDTLAQRTDGGLFYNLTEGHGSMPGQGDRLDERTRWDLVNYVRTLKIDVR